MRRKIFFFSVFLILISIFLYLANGPIEYLIKLLLNFLSSGFKCGLCSSKIYLVIRIFLSLYIFLIGFILLISSLDKKIEDYINNNFKRILMVLIILLLLFLFFNSIFRYMDGDEGEHIHAGWYISQGYIPLIDFFEHHHMLLNFIIAASIKIFGENLFIFYFWRLVIFIMALICIYTTFLIGKEIFNKETAYIGIVFLITSTFFFSKIIEIRPDVPQTMFGLIAIYFFIKSIKNNFNQKYIMFSGITLAISFLFSQKSIFLAAILFMILFYAYFFNKGLSKKSLLIFMISFFLVILIQFIYIMANNQIYEYFIFNWIFNVKYVDHFSVFFTLVRTLIQNTFLWIFLFIGVYFILKDKDKIKNYFLIISILLFISILTFRVPFRQYFLNIFPLIALISAYGFSNLTKKMNKILVLLIILLIILFPFIYLLHESVITNTEDINKINFIISKTDKDDYVYDPLRFNFFRKDIDFFWFNQGYAVETYKKIKDYHYYVYESIEKYKPKIISTGALEMDNPIISQNYKKTEYPDFMERVS